MDKIVENWIERSQYDLDTAKVMLDTSRYLYVAYMCQQMVEKMAGFLTHSFWIAKDNWPKIQSLIMQPVLKLNYGTKKIL